jgi:hypothetical protein
MADTDPPTSIEPSEFDGWLTPRSAIHLLTHLSFHQAIKGILFRIRNHELRTVAEKATVTRFGSSRIVRYNLIDQAVWANSDASSDHCPVWSTGDLSASIPGQSYQAPSTEVDCINVRLDPADVARLLPQPIPSPDTLVAVRPPRPLYRARPKNPPRVGVSKVTVDELRLWFAEYARANQDFRAAAVQAAAEAAFKPRDVTRQPVRDVIGEFEKTINRGKPKGSR